MRQKLIQLMKETPESDDDVDRSLDAVEIDEWSGENADNAEGDQEDLEEDRELPGEADGIQEQQEEEAFSDDDVGMWNGEDRVEERQVDPASIPLPETPIAVRACPG